ncbi:hypothetical protein [Candidatus Mesenet endosymbiont of Agriotes lineatus]|uniref:hypothetical protein n=1 Tax=Candidatus Mesenet endosymbiont of Agriotes lineatus TaxID=3077948 RepID=UPI0030CF1D08
MLSASETHLKLIRDNLELLKQIILRNNLVALALTQYILDVGVEGIFFIKDNLTFFLRFIEHDKEISGHFIANLLYSEERITLVERNLNIFFKMLQHDNFITFALLHLMLINEVFLDCVKSNEKIFTDIVLHNSASSVALLSSIFETKEMITCKNHLQSFIKLIKFNTNTAIYLIQGMFSSEVLADSVDNHLDLFIKIASHESAIMLSLVERIFDNEEVLTKIVSHQQLLEIILDVDENVMGSAIKMSIWRFLQNQGGLRGLEDQPKFLALMSKLTPHLDTNDLVHVLCQYQCIASSPQILSLYERNLIKWHNGKDLFAVESIRKAVLKQMRNIIAVPEVYKEHIDSAIYDMLCNTGAELWEIPLPTLSSLCLDKLLSMANVTTRYSLQDSVVSSNLHEVEQLVEAFNQQSLT